jgi:hypothetical protein
MDYVQDVSVFLVSNFRLQVFDAAVRRRINQSILAFSEFARGYAKAAGDETFELRLGLGMARAFITSTRFVLDPELSKMMFFRGRFLLERIIEAKRAGALDKFSISREVLVD